MFDTLNKVLYATDFKVGDFFKDSDGDDSIAYYRIVGAFQALKSFIGQWGEDIKAEDEEDDDDFISNIQKRGK